MLHAAVQLYSSRSLADRNREDESVACRGSIAMAVATLHPSSDGSRFEVHSKVSSSVPKFIVKSAHRAEIARWIQTVKLNIDYHSQGGKPPAPSVDTRAAVSRRPTSLKVSPLAAKPPSSVSYLPPTDDFLSPNLARTTTSLSAMSLPNTRRDQSPSGTADGMTDAGDTISLADNASMVGDSQQVSHGIPHDATFDLGVLNIQAQVELTRQLLDSIVTPPGVNLSPSPSRQQAVEALRSSLNTLATLTSQQNIMSQDRERYLLGRIHREVEARKLWEENMMQVAHQQADMDKQLTEASRDNEKKRRALRQAKGVLAGLNGSLPLSPMSPPGGASAPPTSTSVGPGILDVALGSATSAGPPVSSPRGHRESISIQHAHDAVVAAGAGSDSDDGDDDEFFDAIEANNIPNLKLHDSIAKPERPSWPVSEMKPVEREVKQPQAQPSERGTIKDLLARRSLEPYAHVRNKLPIDDDKRPSVSCE